MGIIIVSNDLSSAALKSGKARLRATGQRFEIPALQYCFMLQELSLLDLRSINEENRARFFILLFLFLYSPLSLKFCPAATLNVTSLAECAAFRQISGPDLH